MTRTRAFAALSALCTVVVAMAPTPTSAQPQPAVTVAPGQTVTTTFRALVGANYTRGRRPVNCSLPARTSCDTIPVVLDLTPEQVQAGEYILTVRTIWNTKATTKVPATGDTSDDQLNTYLYTDPVRIVTEKDEVTGEETKTETQEADAFLQPSPTEISLFKPPTNKFLVTVENMYGVNDGYTLEIGLADLSGGPGSDLSEDRGGSTFDLSDDTNVAVTPSFSGDTGPSGGVSLPVSASEFGGPLADFANLGGPVSLDILAPRLDGQLDSLGGVEAQTSLDLGKVEKIGRISSGPPAPQSASGLALALWFGVLPIALAAGALFFTKRRSLATR